MYLTRSENYNQMEDNLLFLEFANQIATKINKEYKNIHAYADVIHKGAVIIFTNDFDKRVEVPYSFFTPKYATSFTEQLQECLDVINDKKYETSKIKKVM